MGYRVGRFVARRLEVAAVAGLLWILWCVLGAAGYRFFPFFVCLNFECPRLAASMRPACLIYLSTSTGVHTGCHYGINLSACVCIIGGFC